MFFIFKFNIVNFIHSDVEIFVFNQFIVLFWWSRLFILNCALIKLQNCSQCVCVHLASPVLKGLILYKTHRNLNFQLINFRLFSYTFLILGLVHKNQISTLFPKNFCLNCDLSDCTMCNCANRYSIALSVRLACAPKKMCAKELPSTEHRCGTGHSNDPLWCNLSWALLQPFTVSVLQSITSAPRTGHET